MDIDLKYIGQIDEETARAERDDIDEKMVRILNDQGHSIKKRKIRSSGSRLETRFESAIEGMSRPHIDLGYVERQPLFGVTRMTSVELCGVRAIDMLVFDLEEVVAGKLAALVMRDRSRDLFDALRIKEIIDDLDMESIRAAIIASVVASPDGWQERWIGDPNADPHETCQDLMTCLPYGYFRNKDAVIAWYNESIRICQECFGDLLVLTDQERRFVDGIQNRGEIRADLLSAPPELRARIGAATQLARRCRFVLDRQSERSQ